MPTWSEFVAQFGLPETLLTIFAVAVIVLAREERRLFRRRRDEKPRI